MYDFLPLVVYGIIAEKLYFFILYLPSLFLPNIEKFSPNILESCDRRHILRGKHSFQVFEITCDADHGCVVGCETELG